MPTRPYYRYIIKGIVQGVGFRPTVCRLAKANGIKGEIRNTTEGVEIIADTNSLETLLKDKNNIPPLAIITSIEKQELSTTAIKDRQYTGFSITESISPPTSKGASSSASIIPPDIFMCPDCEKELRNSKDRRHNYYFTTCTNCGPRFSMTIATPYDRKNTSMSGFDMCERCRNEYRDQNNRRYHAETIACKSCGPKLTLTRRNNKDNKDKKDNKDNKNISCISEPTDEKTIEKAARIINTGNIISIKGIGGYHICALATKAPTKKIRDIIHRPDKPFAIMAKDLEMAKRMAEITKKEATLLESPARPIVALKKRKRDEYSHVSELDTIGIMLPYTALHLMLFDYIDEPLVMTSANMPGSPTELENPFTEYSLDHERKIINRCDDSVLKTISGNTLYLRRSRGYVPLPIRLPIECTDTLALGAGESNTIAIAKGHECHISQHIGDTKNTSTMEFLKSALETMTRMTNTSPEIIACDIHPHYATTAYAKELAEKTGARLIQLQHHKAHVAGAAAEHNLEDYIGIAIDGTGFGEDGTVWGGEIFDVKGGKEFTRIAHLEQHPMVGAESAITSPKKMLFGILAKFMDEKDLEKTGLYKPPEILTYKKMLHESFNTPLTSSAGRTLDAASALLGFCDNRTYDGRPAMLLESHSTTPYSLNPVIKKSNNTQVLMTTPLFQYLKDNLKKDKRRLAATAQKYLADGLYQIAEESGKPIVLSGGCAYNRIITTTLTEKNVLTNKEIPAGDGGIAFGQAYLANQIKN